jgi:hypothetical protein
VKAYRELCVDLMMMLEDLEESLEEITKAAQLSEFEPEKKHAEGKSAGLNSDVELALKHSSKDIS